MRKLLQKRIQNIYYQHLKILKQWFLLFKSQERETYNPVIQYMSVFVLLQVQLDFCLANKKNNKLHKKMNMNRYIEFLLYLLVLNTVDSFECQLILNVLHIVSTLTY
jgi:hypothetical protein